MGVSVDQWRIHIGLFAGKMKGRKSNTALSHLPRSSSILLSIVMAMMTLTLLLLIGNIKLDPEAATLSNRFSAHDFASWSQIVKEKFHSGLPLLIKFVLSTWPATDTIFPQTAIRLTSSVQLTAICAYIFILLLLLKQLSLVRRKTDDIINRARPHKLIVTSLNLVATTVAASVICYLLAIGNVERNPGPFPCKVCPVVPETIASNVRHQHFHRMDSNFKYFCPSPDCVFFTPSFGSMNNHVSEFHRKTKHQDPVSHVSFACSVPNCDESAPSLWNLIQHFYRHLENGINIPSCPMPGCNFPQPFTKKQNLQVHMAQTHTGWRDEGAPKKKLSTENIHPSHFSSNPSTSTMEYEDVDCVNTEQLHDTEPFVQNDIDPLYLDDSLVFDCIAKFYLKLYAEYFLPYSLIQEISEGLSFLCNLTHSRVKLILSQELKNLQISDYQINLILYKIMRSDLMFASHRKDMPGPSFTSDHLREKYFKDHLNFKPPTEISLDKNRVKTDKKYQYVPILETITTLLEDPSVQKEIDKCFQEQPAQRDGIISNYTEGQQFKSENHPRKEFHLFVYQDGINPVMNVLGSAKNKYKQLAVYFTIGNLRSTLRSKVASKHLVMLIRESVMKTVGATKCFERLKADLTKLEQDGINYKGENIKAVVVYSIGDNLGQHFFGGFVESFSGTFFCRYCNIKRETYKKNPSVTYPLRTRLSYKKCVWKVKLTNKKSCQGIKRDSIFNDLKYFHSSTHLTPCCGHDLFEGCVSWDLSGIIATFVKLKWFSYDLLNKRIRKFRCIGTDSPNKPACVNIKGTKLGGHAVQNWTLLRLLPFIIGDKIRDLNHDAWKLYLQLKELCEYFCGPEFLIADLPYIKDVLLPQYFQLRSKVLTTKDVRPKHHFMCHYPELMLKYGPLLQLWTLPYEQKHKMFKHICRLSRNFKNVEYTCATRHQLNLAYLGTGPLFPEETIEYGSNLFSPYTYSGHLTRFLQDLNMGEGWRECQSILKDGVTYKKGDLLLLSASGNTITAGFISVILTRGSVLDFILETTETSFTSNLGVYQLPPDRSEVFQKVSRESLQHPVPQPLYLFQGLQCFSLKYKLLQDI